MLPLPDDVADATLVADAIGWFVAWSSSLVCVDNEVCLKSFTIQIFKAIILTFCLHGNVRLQQNPFQKIRGLGGKLSQLHQLRYNTII